MSPNASSRPYLPQHIITALKNDPVADFITSTIHSAGSRQFRVLVVSQRMHPQMPVGLPVEPPHPNSLPSEYDIPALDKWDKDDGKCHLHLAVVALDLPLVYESLRMGVNPSHKDACGITPLYLLLEWARSSLLGGSVVQLAIGKRTSHDLDRRAIRARASRIAILLVEQHADINSGYRHRTPLSISIELGMWDVVELLLRHKVRIPPLNKLTFASDAVQLTYLKLFDSVGQVTSRPPRPCPCWSGKLLLDCHAAGWVPYPLDFLCCCGKNRKYSSCCSKREFKWMERWSVKYQRFEVTQDINQVYRPEVPEWVTGLPGYSEGVDFIQEGVRGLLSEGDGNLRERWYKDNMQQHKGEFFEQIFGSRPDYEPGYAYANAKCDFVPRPWHGQISKMEAKSRMDEWNGLVDEYIESGTDRRSRFDIERTSKIGLHGGPLYRQCDADGCETYEVRDVALLKQCSACKLVVYCSPACQKTHWRTHKQECGIKSHTAQQLPMQWAMERYLQMMPALASSASWEELLTRMTVIERDMICSLASPEKMVCSPLNDIYGGVTSGEASTIRSPLTI